MTTEIPDLPPLPSSARELLPDGACDAHAHVFGPFDRFPLAEERSYTPPEATFEAHRAMLDAVGFDRGVVVQGSAHGTDNRAILDAVARSDGRLRGIVVVDADASDDELANMAASGICGARFTQMSSQKYKGGMKGVSNLAVLAELAPRLREHGLHAQIFANAPTIAEDIDALRSYDIPVVVDHMGRIGGDDWDQTSPAYTAILDAMREGWMWAKVTMVRSSRRFPAYEDAKPFHDALIEANPEQVVFGSDWPFLNLGEAVPDTADLLRIFRSWTGPDLSDRILADNPARLYGFG